jgi:Tfp pilus assembly protein PilF
MINSRYRLPVIPVFILFAAYAITRIYESIKLSSPKILLYITIILFSLGLVVLPLESVVGKSEKKDVLITALSFLKAKKYDEAEKLLKELIENDSQYIVAYNQLGNVYMRKGEIEKAESILKKGISLNSRTPSLYDSLGVIYTDKSMLIEAVKQFKKAVQLMPNNAEYRYHLGFALLKKGQLDAGIKEVKKAVEIIEKPIYYNTLGIAYMQKGQKKQAVECWNRAIELDEDFKPAKDNLNRY